MVVLLLGDLLNLIKELPDAELQLAELLLLGHVGVVDGVLADLDVQVDALQEDVQDLEHIFWNINRV